MKEKPYTTTKYSVYDKSLYLQRLLFAIDNNFRGDLMDKYAIDCKDSLMTDAGKSIDDAITALTDALEIIGYFPAIREVSGGRQAWRQPTKITG